MFFQSENSDAVDEWFETLQVTKRFCQSVPHSNQLLVLCMSLKVFTVL